MELIGICVGVIAFLFLVSTAPRIERIHSSSEGYPSKEDWDAILEGRQKAAKQAQLAKVDRVRRYVQSGLKRGQTNFAFSKIFNCGAGDGDNSKERACQVVREELKAQGITGVNIYDDWWPDLC